MASKILYYGGRQNVVISQPDIFSFKLTKEFDFIILGCNLSKLGDGVFDVLQNKEVLEAAFSSMIMKQLYEVQCSRKSLGVFACDIVDNILRSNFMRKSTDNVSVVFIALKNITKIGNLLSDTNITNRIFNTVNEKICLYTLKQMTEGNRFNRIGSMSMRNIFSSSDEDCKDKDRAMSLSRIIL